MSESGFIEPTSTLRFPRMRLHPPTASRRALRTSIEPVTMAVADLAALTTVTGALALSPMGWWLWAYTAVVILGLIGSGHYRHRLTLSVTSQARSVFAITAIPLLVLAAARLGGASPATLLEASGLTCAAVLTMRAVAYSTIRTLRTRAGLLRRTLIVGAGQVGHQLAGILMRHREYGLDPIGFVDDVEASGLALPLSGGVDLLRFVLSEEHIEHVVVAFGVVREDSMIDIFRACDDASIDVHVLPRFFELATPNGRDVDNVWGFPLEHLRRPTLRSHASTAKRALDVSLALLGLMLLSPLYAALALAVKVSSRGPVHFCQERVGQRGTIVRVIKFRSMYVHDGSDTEWSAATRVTRVGKVLRKTGLDELPQLWNVVRGDMSIVGPRPERPFFVEQFKAEVPHYDDRHRVPVGLTGLAQVHGLRGDTSIQERARFDNNYIENWSLMEDVRIILQTAGALARWVFRPTIEESKGALTEGTSEEILTGELHPLGVNRTPDPMVKNLSVNLVSNQMPEPGGRTAYGGRRPRRRQLLTAQRVDRRAPS